MEERNQKQRITQHLQNTEVQQRILQDMQRAREEATVTISNAASLFDFTENQLRDWEKNGLISPQRRATDTEQDGKGAKRRQYTTSELDKLAVIRELMNAGFSPGTIRMYVDEIWTSVVSNGLQQAQAREEECAEVEEVSQAEERVEVKHVHIDQRVEQAEQEEFWRYFVSQALRLSLLLICEDVPDTVAGVILPLEKENVAEMVTKSEDVPNAGYSLIGWLGESRSFYTFLESKPSFEHPSDFRVESLKNLAGEYARGQGPENNILIIIQRKVKPIILSKEVVETVQRLLGLVYETVKEWQESFEVGRRDWMYQVTDFSVSSSVSDEVLNGLTNIVVRLGGKMADGRDKWRFACILTPEDASLPVSKRTLLVRAQSDHAPHRLAAVSAEVPGLSFRAYQSGQIIYRFDVSNNDFMIAYQDREKFTRSAIAVPLVGENGMALGVLYVSSEGSKAFSKGDERLLRFVGRMIEELLMVYRRRRLPATHLPHTIAAPEVVDLSFKEFASESDFVNDIEELLKNIQEHGVMPELAGKELSIIAVDIDNLASTEAKYGEIVARNLSREVGERVQSTPAIQVRKLYHSFADRYYLLLKNMRIEEARNNALTLKERLKEEYRIDVRRIFTRRAILPNEMLSLSNVTVRLSVHSYTYEKLKELLDRYENSPVSTLSGILLDNIDKALNMGQDYGGDIVISWDREKWGYITLP